VRWFGPSTGTRTGQRSSLRCPRHPRRGRRSPRDERRARYPRVGGSGHPDSEAAGPSRDGLTARGQAGSSARLPVPLSTYGSRSAALPVEAAGSSDVVYTALPTDLLATAEPRRLTAALQIVPGTCPVSRARDAFVMIFVKDKVGETVKTVPTCVCREVGDDDCR
jgi:hypothetical protein